MKRVKGLLVIGVGILSLVLEGVLCAAPRAEMSGTGVRVDPEAGTMSVQVRDRMLTVALLSDEDHDNPVIDISGWHSDGRYQVASSDTAPVIFIDLYETLPGFKTAVLPVDMGWITRVRMGHHPDRLRIALDGESSDLPEAEAIRQKDGLVITLNAGKTVSETIDTSLPLPVIPGIAAVDQTAAPEKKSGQAQAQPRGTSYIIRQSIGDAPDPVITPDSMLFQEAVSLFDNRQWSMARNKVQQIIDRYPAGPYAEKARFLKTDILQALFPDEPAANYRELMESFQDVLNRYPHSIYRGGALLGMAGLHRNMGNHAEALAYYELARNSASEEDGLIVQQAMLGTAKIHLATGRMNQALSVLENLLKMTEIPAIKNEALLETARLRYEQKFFNESLNLLDQLVSHDKNVYFQYPDVSLYTGNNYFQLGRYDRAETHLLHYYNAVPDKRGKDLILARVGDAFLQGGRVMDAVRCFQLVVERYPDTKGAAISWLRLAEQKDKHPDDAIRMSYSAKKIYENIRDAYQGRPINDSLALLAVLKLAVLYHDEKRYSESLDTLHLFFQNNPDRSLRENGRFALKNVLESLIQKAYEEKDYDRVIGLYTQEALPVVALMDPDPVLLMVARAYRHKGDSDAALVVYQKMAASMPLEKLPDDALFFTGKASVESSQPDLAGERLLQLISAYPGSPYAGEAMNLMGQILMDRGNFQDAVAMMTRALSHPLPPCERAALLVRTGWAALAYQDLETTRSTLEDAIDAMDQCPSLAGYLGDQIGDLYVQTGDFDKAVSIFNHVLTMADAGVEKSFLQYKTAEILWRSGKQEAARALFETLAARNELFWSQLAREHLDMAEFDNAVR